MGACVRSFFFLFNDRIRPENGEVKVCHTPNQGVFGKVWSGEASENSMSEYISTLSTVGLREHKR